jgi:hypothetical protein
MGDPRDRRALSRWRSDGPGGQQLVRRISAVPDSARAAGHGRHRSAASAVFKSYGAYGARAPRVQNGEVATMGGVPSLPRFVDEHVGERVQLTVAGARVHGVGELPGWASPVPAIMTCAGWAASPPADRSPATRSSWHGWHPSASTPGAAGSRAAGAWPAVARRTRPSDSPRRADLPPGSGCRKRTAALLRTTGSTLECSLSQERPGSRLSS